MAHRKWKETKLQPDTDGPGNLLGCCLLSFHILWAILCPQAVVSDQSDLKLLSMCVLSKHHLIFGSGALDRSLAGMKLIWKICKCLERRGAAHNEIKQTAPRLHSVD